MTKFCNKAQHKGFLVGGGWGVCVWGGGGIEI